MLKRRDEIKDKELRIKLHKTYVDPVKQCASPYLNESGENFKLVEKPNGRIEILKKYYKVVKKDNKLYVKIPLGVHGADHLGLDEETGEIGCVLCKGDK